MKNPICYTTTDERTKAVETWTCEACGKPWGGSHRGALACCARGKCDTCGRDTRTIYTDRCSRCREFKALAAAEVVPETDVVYDPGWEKFFTGLGELLDEYEAVGLEPPARVWACEPETISVDLDRLIESEQERLEREDEDHPEPVDLDALRIAVDAFNAAQTDQSWRPTRKACLVPQPDDDAGRDEDGGTP